MAAIIIIRIEDEQHAAEVRAVGARDLAESFLPSCGIKPSSVTVTHRTPENEAKAMAGQIDFKERFDSWPNPEISGQRAAKGKHE